MIVNIELENKEDLPFIKQLLEKIKGVKSVSVETDDEFYNDGTPKWFIDKIADYADRVEKEDMISEKEFNQFLDSEMSKLTFEQ